MRPEAEQLDAILQQDVSAWVREQVADFSDLDDLDYHDFITVTPEQALARVLREGFPSRVVWSPGMPPHEREDHLVIEPSARGWEVFYYERGDRSAEATHASYEEAARDVVMRLFDSAWTALNHRYWHAHHPELPQLPPFGAPWPRPKAPRAV